MHRRALDAALPDSLCAAQLINPASCSAALPPDKSKTSAPVTPGPIDCTLIQGTRPVLQTKTCECSVRQTSHWQGATQYQQGRRTSFSRYSREKRCSMGTRLGARPSGSMIARTAAGSATAAAAALGASSNRRQMTARTCARAKGRGTWRPTGPPRSFYRTGQGTARPTRLSSTLRRPCPTPAAARALARQGQCCSKSSNVPWQHEGCRPRSLAGAAARRAARAARLRDGRLVEQDAGGEQAPGVGVQLLLDQAEGRGGRVPGGHARVALRLQPAAARLPPAISLLPLRPGHRANACPAIGARPAPSTVSGQKCEPGKTGAQCPVGAARQTCLRAAGHARPRLRSTSRAPAAQRDYTQRGLRHREAVPQPAAAGRRAWPRRRWRPSSASASGDGAARAARSPRRAAIATARSAMNRPPPTSPAPAAGAAPGPRPALRLGLGLGLTLTGVTRPRPPSLPAWPELAAGLASALTLGLALVPRAAPMRAAAAGKPGPGGNMLPAGRAAPPAAPASLHVSASGRGALGALPGRPPPPGRTSPTATACTVTDSGRGAPCGGLSSSGATPAAGAECGPPPGAACKSSSAAAGTCCAQRAVNAAVHAFAGLHANLRVHSQFNTQPTADGSDCRTVTHTRGALRRVLHRKASHTHR